MGVPLLRLRSDEQLVALFRDGHDDAFRVIHDRYSKRLLAYVRQMLPRRSDAEDALQEVFVRAYFGLRAHDRELTLRSWLFRVAHNRCIDELRRPAPPPPEILELVRSSVQDPVVEAERRESLRRLIADVRRLPDQQRSALLMRELGGMSYADLSLTLEISVPAVKSLLVRARVSLARSAEARDTACSDIREALVEAHDQGVRPAAVARRHMRDCSGCRSFRRGLRSVSRGLAAFAPAWWPIGAAAKLLSGSGSAGGGGSAALGAVGAGGTASSTGIVIGANHVVALIAAAVATGGAVEIQHTIAPSPPTKPAAARAKPAPAPAANTAGIPQAVVYTPGGQIVVVPDIPVGVPAVAVSATGAPVAAHHPGKRSSGSSGLAGAVTGGSASAAQTVDSSTSGTGAASGSSSATSTSSSPTLADGSLVGDGSGSNGAGSGSSASPSSGSQTSGSSTGAVGGGTTGSTSGTSISGTTTSGSTSSSSGSGTTSSGSSSASASTSSASGSSSTSSGSGTTSSGSSSGTATK